MLSQKASCSKKTGWQTNLTSASTKNWKEVCQSLIRQSIQLPMDNGFPPWAPVLTRIMHRGSNCWESSIINIIWKNKVLTFFEIKIHNDWACAVWPLVSVYQLLVGIPTGMDNRGVFCQTWWNSDQFSTLNFQNRPKGSKVSEYRGIPFPKL